MKRFLLLFVLLLTVFVGADCSDGVCPEYEQFTQYDSADWTANDIQLLHHHDPPAAWQALSQNPDVIFQSEMHDAIASMLESRPLISSGAHWDVASKYFSERSGVENAVAATSAPRSFGKFLETEYGAEFDLTSVKIDVFKGDKLKVGGVTLPPLSTITKAKGVNAIVAVSGAVQLHTNKGMTTIKGNNVVVSRDEALVEDEDAQQSVGRERISVEEECEEESEEEECAQTTVTRLDEHEVEINVDDSSTTVTGAVRGVSRTRETVAVYSSSGGDVRVDDSGDVSADDATVQVITGETQTVADGNFELHVNENGNHDVLAAPLDDGTSTIVTYIQRDGTSLTAETVGERELFVSTDRGIENSPFTSPTAGQVIMSDDFSDGLPHRRMEVRGVGSVYVGSTHIGTVLGRDQTQPSCTGLSGSSSCEVSVNPARTSVVMEGAGEYKDLTKTVHLERGQMRQDDGVFDNLAMMSITCDGCADGEVATVEMATVDAGREVTVEYRLRDGKTSPILSAASMAALSEEQAQNLITCTESSCLGFVNGELIFDDERHDRMSAVSSNGEVFGTPLLFTDADTVESVAAFFAGGNLPSGERAQSLIRVLSDVEPSLYQNNREYQNLVQLRTHRFERIKNLAAQLPGMTFDTQGKCVSENCHKIILNILKRDHTDATRLAYLKLQKETNDLLLATAQAQRLEKSLAGEDTSELDVYIESKQSRRDALSSPITVAEYDRAFRGEYTESEKDLLTRAKAYGTSIQTITKFSADLPGVIQSLEARLEKRRQEAISIVQAQGIQRFSSRHEFDDAVNTILEEYWDRTEFKAEFPHITLDDGTILAFPLPKSITFTGRGSYSEDVAALRQAKQQLEQYSTRLQAAYSDGIGLLQDTDAAYIQAEVLRALGMHDEALQLDRQLGDAFQKVLSEDARRELAAASAYSYLQQSEENPEQQAALREKARQVLATIDVQQSPTALAVQRQFKIQETNIREIQDALNEVQGEIRDMLLQDGQEIKTREQELSLQDSISSGIGFVAQAFDFVVAAKDLALEKSGVIDSAEVRDERKWQYLQQKKSELTAYLRTVQEGGTPTIHDPVLACEISGQGCGQGVFNALARRAEFEGSSAVMGEMIEMSEHPERFTDDLTEAASIQQQALAWRDEKSTNYVIEQPASAGALVVDLLLGKALVKGAVSAVKSVGHATAAAANLDRVGRATKLINKVKKLDIAIDSATDIGKRTQLVRQKIDAEIKLNALLDSASAKAVRIAEKADTRHLREGQQYVAKLEKLEQKELGLTKKTANDPVHHLALAQEAENAGDIETATRLRERADSILNVETAKVAARERALAVKAERKAAKLARRLEGTPEPDPVGKVTAARQRYVDLASVEHIEDTSQRARAISERGFQSIVQYERALQQAADDLGDAFRDLPEVGNDIRQHHASIESTDAAVAHMYPPQRTHISFREPERSKGCAGGAIAGLAGEVPIMCHFNPGVVNPDFAPITDDMVLEVLPLGSSLSDVARTHKAVGIDVPVADVNPPRRSLAALRQSLERASVEKLREAQAKLQPIQSPPQTLEGRLRKALPERNAHIVDGVHERSFRSDVRILQNVVEEHGSLSGKVDHQTLGELEPETYIQFMIDSTIDPRSTNSRFVQLVTDNYKAGKPKAYRDQFSTELNQVSAFMERNPITEVQARQLQRDLASMKRRGLLDRGMSLMYVNGQPRLTFVDRATFRQIDQRKAPDLIDFDPRPRPRDVDVTPPEPALIQDLPPPLDEFDEIPSGEFHNIPEAVVPPPDPAPLRGPLDIDELLKEGRALDDTVGTVNQPIVETFANLVRDNPDVQNAIRRFQGNCLSGLAIAGLATCTYNYNIESVEDLAAALLLNIERQKKGLARLEIDLPLHLERRIPSRLRNMGDAGLAIFVTEHTFPLNHRVYRAQQRFPELLADNYRGLSVDGNQVTATVLVEEVPGGTRYVVSGTASHNGRFAGRFDHTITVQGHVATVERATTIQDYNLATSFSIAERELIEASLSTIGIRQYSLVPSSVDEVAAIQRAKVKDGVAQYGYDSTAVTAERRAAWQQAKSRQGQNVDLFDNQFLVDTKARVHVKVEPNVAPFKEMTEADVLSSSRFFDEAIEQAARAQDTAPNRAYTPDKTAGSPADTVFDDTAPNDVQSNTIPDYDDTVAAPEPAAIPGEPLYKPNEVSAKWRQAADDLRRNARSGCPGGAIAGAADVTSCRPSAKIVERIAELVRARKHTEAKAHFETNIEAMSVFDERRVRRVLDGVEDVSILDSYLTRYAQFVDRAPPAVRSSVARDVLRSLETPNSQSWAESAGRVAELEEFKASLRRIAGIEEAEVVSIHGTPIRYAPDKTPWKRAGNCVIGGAIVGLSSASGCGSPNHWAELDRLRHTGDPDSMHRYMVDNENALAQIFEPEDYTFVYLEIEKLRFDRLMKVRADYVNSFRHLPADRQVALLEIEIGTMERSAETAQRLGRVDEHAALRAEMQDRLTVAQSHQKPSHVTEAAQTTQRNVQVSAPKEKVAPTRVENVPPEVEELRKIREKARTQKPRGMKYKELKGRLENGKGKGPEHVMDTFADYIRANGGSGACGRCGDAARHLQRELAAQGRQAYIFYGTKYDAVPGSGGHYWAGYVENGRVHFMDPTTSGIFGLDMSDYLYYNGLATEAPQLNDFKNIFYADEMGKFHGAEALNLPKMEVRRGSTGKVITARVREPLYVEPKTPRVSKPDSPGGTFERLIDRIRAKAGPKVCVTGAAGHAVQTCTPSQARVNELLKLADARDYDGMRTYFTQHGDKITDTELHDLSRALVEDVLPTVEFEAQVAGLQARVNWASDLDLLDDVERELRAVQDIMKNPDMMRQAVQHESKTRLFTDVRASIVEKLRDVQKSKESGLTRNVKGDGTVENPRLATDAEPLSEIRLKVVPEETVTPRAVYVSSDFDAVLVQTDRNLYVIQDGRVVGVVLRDNPGGSKGVQYVHANVDPVVVAQLESIDQSVRAGQVASEPISRDAYFPFIARSFIEQGDASFHAAGSAWDNWMINPHGSHDAMVNRFVGITEFHPTLRNIGERLRAKGKGPVLTDDADISASAFDMMPSSSLAHVDPNTGKVRYTYHSSTDSLLADAQDYAGYPGQNIEQAARHISARQIESLAGHETFHLAYAHLLTPAQKDEWAAFVAKKLVEPGPAGHSYRAMRQRLLDGTYTEQEVVEELFAYRNHFHTFGRAEQGVFGATAHVEEIQILQRLDILPADYAPPAHWNVGLWRDHFDELEALGRRTRQENPNYVRGSNPDTKPPSTAAPTIIDEPVTKVKSKATLSKATREKIAADLNAQVKKDMQRYADYEAEFDAAVARGDPKPAEPIAFGTVYRTAFDQEYGNTLRTRIGNFFRRLFRAPEVRYTAGSLPDTYGEYPDDVLGLVTPETRAAIRADLPQSSGLRVGGAAAVSEDFQSYIRKAQNNCIIGGATGDICGTSVRHMATVSDYVHQGEFESARIYMRAFSHEMRTGHVDVSNKFIDTAENVQDFESTVAVKTNYLDYESSGLSDRQKRLQKSLEDLSSPAVVEKAKQAGRTDELEKLRNDLMQQMREVTEARAARPSPTPPAFKSVDVLPVSSSVPTSKSAYAQKVENVPISEKLRERIADDLNAWRRENPSVEGTAVAQFDDQYAGGFLLTIDNIIATLLGGQRMKYDPGNLPKTLGEYPSEVLVHVQPGTYGAIQRQLPTGIQPRRFEVSNVRARNSKFVEDMRATLDNCIIGGAIAGLATGCGPSDTYERIIEAQKTGKYDEMEEIFRNEGDRLIPQQRDLVSRHILFQKREKFKGDLNKVLERTRDPSDDLTSRDVLAVLRSDDTVNRARDLGLEAELQVVINSVEEDLDIVREMVVERVNKFQEVLADRQTVARYDSVLYHLDQPHNHNLARWAGMEVEFNAHIAELRRLRASKLAEQEAARVADDIAPIHDGDLTNADIFNPTPEGQQNLQQVIEGAEADVRVGKVKELQEQQVILTPDQRKDIAKKIRTLREADRDAYDAIPGIQQFDQGPGRNIGVKVAGIPVDRAPARLNDYPPELFRHLDDGLVNDIESHGTLTGRASDGVIDCTRSVGGAIAGLAGACHFTVAAKPDDDVSVFLKDGQSFEGTLLGETDSYFFIETENGHLKGIKKSVLSTETVEEFSDIKVGMQLKATDRHEYPLSILAKDEGTYVLHARSGTRITLSEDGLTSLLGVDSSNVQVLGDAKLSESTRNALQENGLEAIIAGVPGNHKNLKNWLEPELHKHYEGTVIDELDLWSTKKILGQDGSWWYTKVVDSAARPNRITGKLGIEFALERTLAVDYLRSLFGLPVPNRKIIRLPNGITLLATREMDGFTELPKFGSFVVMDEIIRSAHLSKAERLKRYEQRTEEYFNWMKSEGKILPEHEDEVRKALRTSFQRVEALGIEAENLAILQQDMQHNTIINVIAHGVDFQPVLIFDGQWRMTSIDNEFYFQSMFESNFATPNPVTGPSFEPYLIKNPATGTSRFNYNMFWQEWRQAVVLGQEFVDGSDLNLFHEEIIHLGLREQHARQIVGTMERKNVGSTLVKLTQSGGELNAAYGGDLVTVRYNAEGRLVEAAPVAAIR